MQNGYCDFDKQIQPAYHEARAAGTLAPLPPELASLGEQVLALVDGLFSDAQLPQIDDDRRQKQNPVNGNLHKREFQALWQRINRKAAYTVQFDAGELVEKERSDRCRGLPRQRGPAGLRVRGTRRQSGEEACRAGASAREITRGPMRPGRGKAELRRRRREAELRDEKNTAQMEVTAPARAGPYTT